MKNKSRIILILLAVPILIALAVLGFEEGKKAVIRAYADSQPRQTPVPSENSPDLIRLTWSADPMTTQTISWRTGPTVEEGAVQFLPLAANDTEVQTVRAQWILVEDSMVVNDPVNHSFSVRLEGLQPGTTYKYRVGQPTQEIWSDWYTFTTAPAGEASYSFFYLGDPQVGFAQWRDLITRANQHYSDAAFVLIPGDLVNRGNFRDDWDDFLNAGQVLFASKPLVPAIGNHERPRGEEPHLYLKLLELMQNGAPTLTPEKSYSFQYANSLFVILDSNEDPEAQREWLEQVLSNTGAAWKFVAFHHPIYSSKANRDNPEIRASWVPLFDKYRVDIVFNGHDHAYMRTFPLRDNKVVDPPEQGTIYVISVSGSKFYEMESRDLAAVAFDKTPTYQVIQVDITNQDVHVLTYRSYDSSGVLRDEFRIEKPKH